MGLDFSLVAFWCGWRVVLWLDALVVWLGCSVRKEVMVVWFLFKVGSEV